jgi:phosphoglycerol geranylgeranyltransferase
MGQVEKYLLEKIKQEGAIHLTLIDPDKESPESGAKVAREAESGGTAAIMIGGSTATSTQHVDALITAIKKVTKIPVIIFPSNVFSVSQYADAIWFMSLLNSYNPYFIIEAQALGAPLIKKYNLEPLPMGYIIVGEGGTAGYIGQAHPIPYNRPEIAALYALAAQYLGMRFVYLEAGSGAKHPVPPEMVAKVRQLIDITTVVGGGIRTGTDAAKIVEAGADAIVTGTVVEKTVSVTQKISEITNGIRIALNKRIR